MEQTTKEKALEAIQRFILQREKKLSKRDETADKLLLEHGHIGKRWSLTQLHIVALINQHPTTSNNTFLAKQLGVSKPAITKAINALMKADVVKPQKMANNQKAVYYSLTANGEKLAGIHEQMHHIAVKRYNELLDPFSEEELGTIIKFLNTWSNQ